MKKIFIILSVIMVTIGSVHADEIPYFDGSVYEALTFAQKKQKMLIVEFYAYWNYKSKWMNENVIAKKDVLAAIDQSFVIVKVDTQTKEGGKLAEMYQVKDYPSFVVFNQNGSVVDKIETSMNSKDFITRLSQITIENDGKSGWELRKINLAIQNSNSELADMLMQEYIERIGIDKAITPFHWEYFSNPYISYFGSLTFDFILENKKKFVDVFSLTKIDDLIDQTLYNSIMPYAIGAYQFDSTHLDFFKDTAIKHSTTNTELLLQLTELAKYRSQNEIDKYISTTESIIRKNDSKLMARLIMSMAFIAEKGSKEQKKTVRNMIDKYGRTSVYGADLPLIEALNKSFSE